MKKCIFDYLYERRSTQNVLNFSTSILHFLSSLDNKSLNKPDNAVKKEIVCSFLYGINRNLYKEFRRNTVGVI